MTIRVLNRFVEVRFGMGNALTNLRYQRDWFLWPAPSLSKEMVGIHLTSLQKGTSPMTHSSPKPWFMLSPVMIILKRLKQIL